MSKKPAHFREVLALSSRVRYAIWRLLGGKGSIDLVLASGIRLRMRSKSTTDYDVAWQIFWRGDYESPRTLRNIRHVVDLGANVGYSVVYWCAKYPQCHVTALEPHPAHLKALNENLTRNAMSSRVKVVAAAAGSTERASYLTDGRSSSAVTDQPTSFPIRVLDLFREQEMARVIDILKIDIEGGEYELLSDPRFARLDVRTLVLEWHQTVDHPDGKIWCIERLKSLGYSTHIGCEDLPHAGLVWAFR